MSYADEKCSDMQTAIAAGAAIGDPRKPVEDPAAGVFAVVPKDYRVEDLAQYLPKPLRVEHGVTLDDTDSFIEYVNTFKGGPSRIFFNTNEQEFEAILDYHSNIEPGWCGHRATYKPQRSVEFEMWMGKNRHPMSQVEFARFIEENMPDIVEPPSATLLESALTFEAKKAVEFSSGVRLANGQIQFQYDEVVRGSTKKGTVEIPEEFVIGVPIHVNGPAYKIPVKLRWRLQESKLSFWYEIVRPHRFIDDALKAIRERVAKETSVPLLAGAA